MNKLLLFQGVSGLDDVKFIDDLSEEEFNVEHQTDLLFALLVGHLPALVFDEMCKRLDLDINETILVCNKSFGKVLSGEIK